MDRTSIECPSCNRKILIALRPSLCSLLPLDLEYSHRPIPSSREYTLQDLLYVHEFLIKENSYLRCRIERLTANLEVERDQNKTNL